MAARRLTPARAALLLAAALARQAACQPRSQVVVAGAEVAEQAKNQKRQELLNQIASALGDFNSAEDRLKQLESDNTAKAAALTEKANFVSGLERTVDELKNQVREKEDRLTALWKEFNDLHAKHDELWGEHGRLRNQINDLSAKNQQLEAANQRLERLSDPSVKQFLESKASKVREGASDETFRYVLPPQVLAGMAAAQPALHDLFGYGSSEETNSWGAALSGSVVYGPAVVPLVCSVWCLTKIVYRLSPCLMLLHLYFVGVALCNAAVAWYTKIDPMDALALHDPSVYVFAQAWFGIFFAAYTLLIAYPLLISARKTDWYGVAKKINWRDRDSEALNSINWSDCDEHAMCRAMQLVLVFPMAANYFSYAWSPAMSNRAPQLGQMVIRMAGPTMGQSVLCVPYLVTAAAFFGCLRLEQSILRASSSMGDSSVMTISVSKDGQLMCPDIATTLAAAREITATGAARIGKYQEIAATFFGSKGTVSDTTR